jgi:hypothetical protein
LSATAIGLFFNFGGQQAHYIDFADGLGSLFALSTTTGAFCFGGNACVRIQGSDLQNFKFFDNYVGNIEIAHVSVPGNSCEWWPSRLVETASEDRLSFRTPYTSFAAA